MTAHGAPRKERYLSTCKVSSEIWTVIASPALLTAFWTIFRSFFSTIMLMKATHDRKDMPQTRLARSWYTVPELLHESCRPLATESAHRPIIYRNDPFAKLMKEVNCQLKPLPISCIWTAIEAVTTSEILISSRLTDCQALAWQKATFFLQPFSVTPRTLMSSFFFAFRATVVLPLCKAPLIGDERELNIVERLHCITLSAGKLL